MPRGRPRLLRRAFTLIELIAVIVVIALLLGLAAFGYTKFISGARETSVKAVAVQVGKAIQAHSAHHQLPYNEDNYDQETVDEALGSDLPHGAKAGPMADTVDEDTNAETATIVVEHEGRTADVVFERDAIGGPGQVAGIGVAAGDGPGSGGGGPPAELPSYDEAVLADNPLAYYKLNETSGTTLTDYSGNNHHGTYPAGVTTAPSLLARDSDPALDFPRVGPARVPNAAWMNVTEFTAEAWFNADATNSAGAVIIGRHNDSGGLGHAGRMFKVYLSPTGNIEAFVRFTDSTGVFLTYGYATGTGTHHVAVTWDGTWARLYLDGVEVASDDSHAGKTVGWPSEGLVLGGDAFDYATTRFDGRLDQVAYYGTALPATSVELHYLAGAGHPEPGSEPVLTAYDHAVLADDPLAYYRFNETAGGALLDHSGKLRHGYYGAPIVTAPSLLTGDTDAAADFNRVSPARVNPSPWMNTDHFTVEAWFDADAGNTAGAEIFTRADEIGGAGDLRRMFQTFIRANGELGVGLTFASGHYLGQEGIAHVVGGAHHLAMTWDGTWLRVYLDGTERFASDAHAGRQVNFPAGIGFTFAGDWRDYGTTRFDGRLDQAAYYGTALSPERIAAHYDAGTS